MKPVTVRPISFHQSPPQAPANGVTMIPRAPHALDQALPPNLILRSQVIALEASLVEEWLSPELMSALRSENLRSDLTEKRKTVVLQFKAQIIHYLREGSFNSRRLADIVNFIQQNEQDFQEWHTSAIARLFAPLVFKNEKRSSGYFF